MNLFSRALLRFIFYSYLISVFTISAPKVYMGTGKLVLFPGSHIELINTPGYSNSDTLAMLRIFNNYSDGAVLFEATEKNRPIYIYETNQFPVEVNPATIGLAFPAVKYCYIYIKSGLDKYTYYHVLLHEYLHCMGYEHHLRDDDLMYYAIVYASEQNIKSYAINLAKRNKRWKNK
jgi:hypothetical protein